MKREVEEKQSEWLTWILQVGVREKLQFHFPFEWCQTEDFAFFIRKAVAYAIKSMLNCSNTPTSRAYPHTNTHQPHCHWIHRLAEQYNAMRTSTQLNANSSAFYAINLFQKILQQRSLHSKRKSSILKSEFYPFRKTLLWNFWDKSRRKPNYS